MCARGLAIASGVGEGGRVSLGLSGLATRRRGNDRDRGPRRRREPYELEPISHQNRLSGSFLLDEWRRGRSWGRAGRAH